MGKKTYNLTLVLIPKLDEFPIADVEQIGKIVLKSNDKTYEYELPQYLIEARETIPEEKSAVSLSSVESEVNEDLSAGVNYGIENKGNDILKFDIDYSKKFNDVVKYRIASVEEKKDTVKYAVDVQLKEKQSKTVFRPFLKVEYKDTSGWLIPTVPVYFK